MAIIGTIESRIIDTMVYYAETIEEADKYRRQSIQEIVFELFSQETYQMSGSNKPKRYFETDDKMYKLKNNIPEVYNRILNYINKNYTDSISETSTFDYWIETTENKAYNFFKKVFDISIPTTNEKIKNIYNLQPYEKNSDLMNLIYEYMVKIKGDKDYDDADENYTVKCVKDYFLEYRRGKSSSNVNITSNMRNNAKALFEVLVEKYGSESALKKELQSKNCFSDLEKFFTDLINSKSKEDATTPLAIHYRMINYMVNNAGTINIAAKYKRLSTQQYIVSTFNKNYTAIPKIHIQELRDNCGELYTYLTGSSKTTLDEASLMIYFSSGWELALKSKFSDSSASKDNWDSLDSDESSASIKDTSNLADKIIKTMIKNGNYKYKEGSPMKSVCLFFQKWEDGNLWE